MADSTAPPTDIPEKKAPTGEEVPVEAGGAGVKVKSEKELEKERKKAEKAKKFAEKQAKVTKDAGKAEKKEKKVKEVKVEEVLPPYVEETPAGEKKILKPLDDAYHKAYSPQVVESAWYSWWEKEGFFKPEFTPDGKTKPEGSFVIPIPPPNVTGALHVGHALANVLQDSLIRWNRMQGKTTLFLPGCDHAGISTQSVVEKMLWKLEKKTRYDLGREEFVKRAWEWKEDYHERITRALKRMGGSYDWSREAFTLDENLSEAVAHTFVTLHEEGIIYRANRLVNWCVQLNTAISNLEVDNKEIEGRTLLDVPGYSKKVEFGVITHFKYQIEGSDETIEVATTRPETMLGDTGIAVHPDDKRYQHLIGKFAIHPIVDRKMPIVADTYVEMDFGTGAVKITPAHDHNDFALGKRHNLEFINIMNDDGTFNANAGPYEGHKRFDVRYSVVDELTKKGLFVKKEDNKMVIPLCAKSKDVIEPIMKPQWWMSMKNMAEEAIKVVKDGTVKIRPESAEKSYFKWLEGIQDWCLSRQLWWGHRCPVYFVRFEEDAGQSDDNELWVSGKTEAEAREKAEKKFPGKKFTLEQDPDVLDTWFSSGLWPFSTLGWPKQTKDLENLYPTSLLETGWDILFFWVARMIMLGIKMTGKVPFTEVYCHQLVRDSEGRKMSKSLGNVIDPLDVIEGITFEKLNGKLLIGNLDPKELATATKFQKTTFPDGIPECGTDALRFCLAQYNTGGGDIQFDVKVMHGHRKFCNKIYQATKYVLGKLGNDYVPPAKAGKTGKESLAERWILHKMNTCAKDIDRALSDREFSKATQIIYAYWYNNLCDVYIENSKSLISSGNAEEAKSAIDTLYTALEGALLMIHPFMPFLTEELWQRLPRRPEDKTPSVCVAKYPVYTAELDDAASEEAYELLLDITKGLRSLTAEYAIKGEGKAFVQAFDDASFKTATAEAQSIQALAGKGIGSVEILDASAPTPDGCVVSSVSSKASVFLHVKGRVDVDAEIKKADSKLKKAQESIKKQEKLLKDKNFLTKATDDLKEAEQKKLEDLEAVVRGVEETVKELQKLRI